MRGTLEKITAVSSSSNQSVALFALDGGMLDTTGIVTLLQRKTRRVLAFYNNNEGLAKLQSPLGFLFGVNGSTDTQNSLAGPHFTQVFDPELFPAVIQNLTGPGVHARITNVSVRANAYLGVEPYQLDELVIFSNEKSEAFLGQFTDPEIKAKLNKYWPSDMPISMGDLDANMLCEFQRWKFESHIDELDALFA